MYKVSNDIQYSQFRNTIQYCNLYNYVICFGHLEQSLVSEIEFVQINVIVLKFVNFKATTIGAHRGGGISPPPLSSDPPPRSSKNFRYTGIFP